MGEYYQTAGARGQEILDKKKPFGKIHLMAENISLLQKDGKRCT